MFAGFCFSGSEFPFLRWLLAGHVRAVFSDLMGRRPDELGAVRPLAAPEAHYYASCFSADYRFGSYNEFTFGRPLFRACAQLGLEVEKAALALGIAVPDDVRLPAMPALNNGGWSILLPRGKATTQLIETLIQNP